ncbi:MAG: aspartate dehydrogenase [Oscillospiraceae bacterium]|nr:aspartate dehydrogenase [Oscillospiraceae bacterium]
MFGKKKQPIAFDKTGKRPVIRSSICTGEQVAGFKDLDTGKFHEVMLIQTDADFREFLRLYGVAEADVGREW